MGTAIRTYDFHRVNRVESVRKLVKKFEPVEKLRVCYEAGPTGYVVYRQFGGAGLSAKW